MPSTLLDRSLVEVTLPSGARVRGVLPTLGTLLRHELLPDDLLTAALKTADPSWLAAARAVGGEERNGAIRYLAVLVAAFPREEFVDGAWQPVTVTAEDILAGRLDEADVDAMENLCLRIATPDQFQPQPVEEVQPGIPGWASFRDEPDGGTGGEDGRALADAPVGAAAGG